MCLQKFLKYLDAPARNDGSRAHQTVRNAKICEPVGPIRADAVKGLRGLMGIDRFFSHVTNVL